MGVTPPGKILGTINIPDNGDYSRAFLRLLNHYNLRLDPGDEGEVLWEDKDYSIRSCGTLNRRHVIEVYNQREGTVTVLVRRDFPQHEKPLKLIGSAEVGQMLGWSSKKVSVYRQRGKLPGPVAQLKMGPVWKEEDIERWALEKGLIKKVINFC